MRKMLVLAVFAAAVAAFVAATGLSATRATNRSAMGAATVVISTKSLPKLGTVLVNAKGRTQYMFVPDKRTKVTSVSTHRTTRRLVSHSKRSATPSPSREAA
jgi:hypothetical protein